MGAYPNIAELLEQVSVGRRSGGGESVVIVATDSTRTESDTCISHIITILATNSVFYHNYSDNFVDLYNDGDRFCELSQLWR